MMKNGRIEDNEQVANFKVSRWINESVSTKLLNLPTVTKNSQNEFDRKRGITRSFHFNPVPSAPKHRYSGEVIFLRNHKALIIIHPPFVQPWEIANADDDDVFFDFSESPLSFGVNANYKTSIAARGKYESKSQIQQQLRDYYVWYRDKIIPGLKMEEFGRLEKDTLKKFNAFGMNVITQ